MSQESHDSDPLETQEWLAALDSVQRMAGSGRAAFLLDKLSSHAQASGVTVPQASTTNFCNTIPVECEKPLPGDLFMAVSYTHLRAHET